MTNYKASAIVSTYKSEIFIRGCLQDLVNQTLYQKDQLEIIVIDSNSPENEGEIVKEFQSKYPHIIYHRTPERETLYAAWNRGIKMAQGEYITNANTDDRHRPDALEIMANYLDHNEEIALVYADQLITNIPNDTWEKTRANLHWNWQEFSYQELEKRCIIGPQPMWRKSLHDQYGYFDKSLKIAGDYEFWLRIGKREKIKLIPEILGLYYENQQGLEQQSSLKTLAEINQIRLKYGIENKGIIAKGSYPIKVKPQVLQFLPYLTSYPLISIIIPTTRPDFLPRTINSILQQTYQKFEIVIIKDGGENIEDLIQSFYDPRINYIHLIEKKGVSGARNTGLKSAKGKYICYLDDDDYYYPEHLETLVTFLESSHYQVAYTDGFCNSEFEDQGAWITQQKTVNFSYDVDLNKLLVENLLPINGVMFEKECIFESGFFDESLATHEDWDFWLRMSLKYPFFHIKKNTFSYTVRKGNYNFLQRWQGVFWSTFLVIHHRYKQYTNFDIKNQQQNTREILGFQCLQKFDIIDKNDLIAINILAITEQIINYSYLLNNITNLYMAYQLTELASKKLPDEPKFYYLFAKVYRFLGQYQSALEAINNYLVIEETKEALSERIYILEYLDQEKALQCQLEFEQKFPQQQKSPKFPIPQPPLNIEPSNFEEFDLLNWHKNVYQQLKYSQKINSPQLIYKPFFSIILPVYNTPAKYLREAIESVINQTYPHWELCVADDASTRFYVGEILTEYAQKDKRIKVVFRQENGHISRASNTALEIATGEYTTFLDHDDLLDHNALLEVAKFLNQHPEADLIYSDEDKINQYGIYQTPALKPQWCPDSLLSSMYICHLAVYKTSLLKEIGGLRIGYEGSQDHDLALRFTEKTDKIFHLNQILYHWRVHDDSTSGSNLVKPYAYLAGQKAVESALERRGEKGIVLQHQNVPGWYTIRYEIINYDLVSIIIPTRDLANILDRCLESIFSKTIYPNFEVILVDNGSKEVETLAIFEKWKQAKSDQFYCYKYDIPFNYSRLNNYGVTKAKGKYLLFLNNDTEVISNDWLNGMVEQAQRQSIGAVGAYLKYPDQTMQHTGIVIGREMVAQNDYVLALSPKNYSAVTGACLMCRREVFTEINGFDENIAVAFNDVDLCLKILEKGYRNICLPHVLLYHYESKTRGSEDTPEKKARFDKEIKYMENKWGKSIESDPCISPIYLGNPKIEQQISAKFTIIVPWWDHTDLLKLWVNNLKFIQDAEVIFIDNGSQEFGKNELLEFCQNYGIKLIRNEKNLGFSAANNQGLKEATREYILHLNNDLSIECLPFVYLAYLANNGIAGFGRIDPELNIPYIEGWSLCIKKSILEKLGGWNEIYGPGYWDDTDLSYRAKLAGYNVFAIPEMTQWIQHITNITGRDGRIDQLSLHNQNRQKFINQYLQISPKIIVDGVFFQLHQSGIARVWKSLLQEWVNSDFACHILVLDRENTAPKFNNLRYRNIPNYDYNNIELDRQILQQICDEEKADLFISTYYTIPLNTPSVLLIHDLIPEVFKADLNHRNWRGKVSAINYASHYICVSQNTAQDLQKFYPHILDSQITIAYNGVSDCFYIDNQENIDKFKYKYGINKPYFLLGNLNVYKNSILFLKAFAQLPHKTGFDIVATGTGSQLPPEWREYTQGCTFHSLNLTDDELRLAYNGAIALVYPSVYEGFGLPVAEAMACGCPVITTNHASLPEVAGEAALYVKYDDIEGMINLLCEVVKPQVRAKLREAGLQQAQKFSWSTMAEIVKETLLNTILPAVELTEINYLIFPDWNNNQEALALELMDIMAKLALNAHGDKVTLLIDIHGQDPEEIELFLADLAMNLMLEQDLDLSEKLNISCGKDLTKEQWQKILPKLLAKIDLESENHSRIEELELEDLISINLTGKNYLITPNWQEDQEVLAEELMIFLQNLAAQALSEKINLLVKIADISGEDAGLFFSDLVMNLALEADLDLTESLSISLVENLTEKQWGHLLSFVDQS